MDDQLQRRTDDNRASEPVNWSGVATPLPDSSVVYLARHRANDTNTWIELKTQEELADAHERPNEIELRTLFAVPVADLARAPVSTIIRARVVLDGLERRIATAERRVDDRRPPEPLNWDESPDLLDMKAGANELQSAVERATNSSFNFMQIRTADAAAAVSYVKYLAILAGAAQASRCRAQGGDTTDKAAGAASQSQAAPSELASLQRFDHLGCLMIPDQTGDYYLVSDVHSLFSHSAATGNVPEDFLTHQKSWRDAITGMMNSAEPAGPDHDERGYWEHELKAFDRAYAELAASPAAPLAGKVEPVAWMVVAGGKREYVSCNKRDAEDWLKYAIDRELVSLYTAPLAAAVPAEEARDKQRYDTWVLSLEDRTNVPGWHELGAKAQAMWASLNPYQAEPAPIQASALTDEDFTAIWRSVRGTNFKEFGRAIEREVLTRLSKPTAQGAAPKLHLWTGKEITPADLVKSLTTYAKCMPGAGRAQWAMSEAAKYIAAQAPAGRDAVLEEAAEMIDRLNESSGDAAAYDNREMTMHEQEREHALSYCANKIRDLKSHAAEQTEGSK